MRLEPCGIVGVPRHIDPVGIALLEQQVHHRTGERPVGAGERRQVEIGPLCGGGAVGVDDDELGAAFPPRRRDVGHHIDLGRDRVATPHDDQVGFGDLAPIDPALGADAGEPARVGERIADRQILT